MPQPQSPRAVRPSRRARIARVAAAAPRRSAIACALLALVALLAGWLAALVGMVRGEAGRYDFSTFYAAAAALRANPHADIYRTAVLARAGAAAHVLVRPPLPYAYPPLLAIALAPLTLLSFRLLSRLWLAGNAALELVIVALLARELARLIAPALRHALPSAARGPSARPRRWPARVGDPVALVSLALAAAVVLPAAPATQTLLTGQIDLLVLLPLALVPWLSRGGHERWVGVMVALATVLKLTPALLIGYLLLRRRWEAALAALAAVAALELGCALVVGPATLAQSMSAALATGAYDAALGQNEALLASLPGAHAGWLAALGLALRVAIALVAGYALWRVPTPAAASTASVTPNGATCPAGRAPGDAIAGYGAALCLMLLLSPVAWVHHYVWALLAAVIALGLSLCAVLASGARLHRGWARARLALVALACVALEVALPAAWDTQPYPAITRLAGLPLRPLALELRPLATLALLLVLCCAIVPRPLIPRLRARVREGHDDALRSTLSDG